MDFDDIYRLYAPQVFRICMGYTNDYEQARDLTQEMFILVWRHLGSFREQSRISTWIFRIATNNCLKAGERTKKTVGAHMQILENLPDTDMGSSPEIRETEKEKE